MPAIFNLGEPAAAASAEAVAIRRRRTGARSRALRRVFVLVLVAFTVRTFVGEVALVPTSSMEGTILVGDHIILNKSLYGPQVPYTRLRLPALKTAVRGDIVAFRYPHDPSLIYLKRVVAVGGDTVEIRDDVLYLNGIPIREPYVVHKRPAWMRLASEADMKPRRIPAGELFVLGDNRDNSDDSRFWGTVPAGNVIGEPLLVCWSYDAPSRAWLEEDTWRNVRFYASALLHIVPRTRWSRMGTLLR